MEDELQQLMNEFCAEFGLGAVRIPFVIVPQWAVKLYNFLFSPQQSFGRLGGWSASLSPEAKKDILWRELINNPRISQGAGEFEEEDLKILSAAIKTCDSGSNLNVLIISKEFSLSRVDAEKAIAVAKKIREFHAEGKAIKEFKELRKLFYKYQGKLPLITSDKDFEKYVHESIHFVLNKNGIQTNVRAFDEGICTYLHKRFRGWHAFAFYIGHEYAKYVGFFKEKFSKTPSADIGPMLKRRQRDFLRELETGS